MSKKKNLSFDGGPVGYKRPPVEHQFPKGKKPEGSGRKKGSKNYATLVNEIMESRVSVTRDGRQQKIPVKQALLWRAVARALNGTVSDVERFFELVRRLDPEYSQPEMLVHFKKIEGDDW